MFTNSQSKCHTHIVDLYILKTSSIPRALNYMYLSLSVANCSFENYSWHFVVCDALLSVRFQIQDIPVTCTFKPTECWSATDIAHNGIWYLLWEHSTCGFGSLQFSYCPSSRNLKPLHEYAHNTCQTCQKFAEIISQMIHNLQNLCKLDPQSFSSIQYPNCIEYVSIKRTLLPPLP